MNKGEQLDYFIENVAFPQSEALFQQVMGHFVRNKQQVIDEFVFAFQSLCRNIREQQASRLDANPAYVQFSLLLSHVLLHKPPYIIEAFDKDYYWGNVVGQAAYHPRWMFEPLEAFYEELKQEAKKYVLTINPLEVETIYLAELKKHERIMKLVAKEAVETLLDTDEYAQLPYDEEVQFRIGEFRGDTELLFIKNAQNDAIWRYVSGVLSNQAR
ncbi:hypothetical protein E2R60_04215 [Paenibacillus dendritiformis]|uniref:hypothetical protein n=1 Tax=Paenibacillus dendritiformis TaxID=130049 RepID=UPI001059E655|nr:hypothetical protein [Paenibacillus dendritiformis]TDL57704.1 hypothetical protein E2R60_04215 [Paenibacillus dendritiformis]